MEDEVEANDGRLADNDSSKAYGFLASSAANYGKKKKTEQLLREQKSMKMLTNLHKIYSE